MVNCHACFIPSIEDCREPIVATEHLSGQILSELDAHLLVSYI